MNTDSFLLFFGGLSFLKIFLVIILPIIFLICLIVIIKYLKQIKDYLAFISRSMLRIIDDDKQNK